MPQSVPPKGPFQGTGGGCYYVVEERISLQPDLLIESPPQRVADMTPPECWVELTYERHRVDVEIFRIVEYLAKARSLSNWEIAGLVLLGVVVAASGIGAVVAFAGAAAAATAGAAATVVTVKAGIGAALTATTLAVGKAEFDWAKELATTQVSDPDDWEITGTALNTVGPLRRELNKRPERPRVDRFIVPCDRVITGIDEFVNTNAGLDTGAVPPPAGGSSGAPAGGAAPVGSGTGTAPVGSGTGTAPVGSGSGGGGGP